MSPEAPMSSMIPVAKRQVIADGTARPHGSAAGAPHFPLTATKRAAKPACVPTRFGRLRARWLEVGEPALAVFHWEIRAFFLRPAAWVMLLTASLVAGWCFAWLVTLLARGGGASLRTVDDPIVQFLGPNLFLVGLCTLFVPVLTMNSIADERRRGTWELLLTSRVSVGQVLAGKFAALWCALLAALAPWPYFLAVLRVWNGKTRILWGFIPWFDGSGVPFDSGSACGGILGLSVMAATCVALGLFCSSLCRRPASAALLTFVAMTVLLAISFLPRVLDVWGFAREQTDWIETLSCWGQLERLCRGTLRPREFVAQLSFCGTLLWLTAWVARRVDDEIKIDLGRDEVKPTRRTPRRWKSLIALVLALGLANSAARLLPEQVDLTHKRAFTLAPQTQNLLTSLADPVEITILAPREPKTAADRAFAQAAVMFRDLVDLYRQVQPSLVVREWDPRTSADARRLLQLYPDVTTPCVVVRQGHGENSRHEVLHARDLAEVRIARGERPPVVEFFGEQALTAALARLTSGRKQMVVYVLTGHGELSLDDDEPASRQGLGVLAAQWRELDIELRSLDLRAAQHVPVDADLVLLAGGEQPFATDEVAALSRYWAHGGKGLVLCELNYDPQIGGPAGSALESVLADYGLLAGTDRVIMPGVTGSIEAAAPGLPAAGDHPLVRSLSPASVLLYECRSVRSLTQVSHTALRVTPILVSHPAPQAWADGDFSPGVEPEPGGERDLPGPVAMAQAVERRKGDLAQPVLVVVGDAEFISNRSLSQPSGRSGSSFALACLNWLRGRKDLLGDIPPRRNEGYLLPGTPEEQRGLVWKPTLLLSALIVSAGTMVWLSRRGS
ncbi:MAG: hypothetical protein EXS05_23195 [Planctomycetaceae bacterium]|nr:hypothetical protein [Planctomycetaceae bacterium]